MKILPNRIKVPLNHKLLNFATELWDLWFPLAVASFWMRLLAMYHIVYCEKFMIDPFLRGVTSDLNTITVLGGLCVFLLPWRWLRVLVALFYCVVIAANVDFISENDSNMDFGMADQALTPAFIISTVFNKSLGYKILQSAGIFLFLYWIVRRYRPNRYLIHFIFPLVFVGSFYFCQDISINRNRAAWKQMNLAEDHIRNAIQARVLDSNGQTAEAKRFFLKELENGKPIITMPAPKGTNVLMIVLESVGMDHIKRGWLPYLKSLSSQSIYFPYYLTASANTINGEYSILCADSPGLAIPRPGAVKAWSLVAKKSPPLYCLPHVLASAGYKTIYMQPADLSFQKKGDFMPMAGFQEVYGRKELVDEHGNPALGEWGPDDSQLYEHAMKRIAELQKNPQPWFFNIMTISTHYPANVPETFQLPGITDPNNRKRSSLFADQALQKFMTQLQESGALKNTLLIITNDEVRTSGNDTPEGLRHKNHGVLYIMPPTGEVKTVKDIYTQTDLFLSVADYLGLPTDKIEIGRSVFRSYNNFRPLYFGNFFTKYFFAQPVQKHLLMCSTNDMACIQYKVLKGKNILDAAFEEAPRVKAGYPSLMKQLVTKNAKRTPPLWDEKTDALPGFAPTQAPLVERAVTPAPETLPNTGENAKAPAADKK